MSRLSGGVCGCVASPEGGRVGLVEFCITVLGSLLWTPSPSHTMK